MQSLPDSQSHTALLDRYAQWPYYLPPDDWLVNSDTSSSLHWTNFSPPDDWLADHEELFSQQTGQPGSEMVDRLVEKDPISSPAVDPFPLSQMLGHQSSSGSGRSNNHSALHSPHDGISGPFPPPSPCFAQVPSTGRRDLEFLLYRYGQYATESDMGNPLVHPAFQCYENMTGPDLIWDLTAPLYFPSIARSNIVPLYAEEYHTYLTHPPLHQMDIHLDAFPMLSFVIPASGGFGITVRDFMEKLTYQLNRHLTVEEWNTGLTVDQRHQILSGYERRTGTAIEIDATEIQGRPLSHTPYIISDMLADEPMFLGLAMEDGDPNVWTMYTCKREQCRQYTDL